MEKLVALQSVDVRIQEMERVKEEVPRRISFLEDEIKKAEERALAERNEVEKLLKERRRKEKDLEEEVDRVKKTEARVFEIKTNKEYQAVLKEIESSKKLNRQREEEILEILERHEEKQKQLRQEEKNLEEKRQDFQQQIEELRVQVASFEKEMAQQRRLREERGKEIPSALLRQYQMLLGRRQGRAVAQVVDGVCQACHMNLRPQLYIELQKQDTLILCPNCNRILVWSNGSLQAGQT
jgi:uncharacterized protein